ncbi:MAG: hypothetical protein JRI68_10405, partial [Deltaproteobacteria bacterium]|nr:hypothetical protein [Deltaproteobacteria bacterium]
MPPSALRLLALGAALSCWPAVAGCTCIGDPPGATLSESQRKVIERKIVDRAPNDMVRANARFADRVELVGYRLSPAGHAHEPGGKLRATLVWKVDQPLTGGWLQFTHLVSTE